MFIKLVIIEGFRSYRHRTVISSLHENNNVFVGRNGTGKSNFFSAIAFVLTEDYSRITAEQRLLLLHDGGESQVRSAYVEITIDNEDGRLPMEGRRRDSSDVVIKREISSVKDQYSINGKIRPQTQVMSILETAGFSRSNPYYVVKQGKIAQLATAGDGFRLRLLLDVAGAKTFDKRMVESTKILEKDFQARQKVLGFINELEQHLETLSVEKTELEDYLRLDKTKRSLHYAILDKESKRATEKLDTLMKTDQIVAAAFTDLADRVNRLRDEIETTEQEAEEKGNEVTFFEERLNGLKERLQEILERQSEGNLVISDLLSKCEEEKEIQSKHFREKETVEDEIGQTNSELNELKPKLLTLRKEEGELKEKLMTFEQELTALLAKEGHRERFHSPAERNTWIRKEIGKMKKIQSGLEKEGKGLEMELIGKEEQLNDRKAMREESKKEVAEVMAQFAEENKKKLELKRECDQLGLEKRQVWDKVKQKEHAMDEARRRLSEMEDKHKGLIPRAVSKGLISMNRILSQEPSLAPKVLGLLIDFVDTQPTYFTAIDVTAGNRLFHVVVEKMDVALKILDIMAANPAEFPGELTFLPIDTVRGKQATYPSDANVTPLLDHIQLPDKRLTGIFRHVFGNTLVCRTIDDAVRLSRSAGFTCVTIDGDQVKPRGPITGGYLHKERSRMKNFANVERARAVYDEIQQDLASDKENLDRIDVRIRTTRAEVDGHEGTLLRFRNEYESLKRRPALLENEIKSLQKSLDETSVMLADTKRSAHRTNEDIRHLEEEGESDQLGGLSPQDRTRMDVLVSEAQTLKRDVQRKVRERSRMEVEITGLTQRLEMNLTKRKRDLDMSLDDGQMDRRDWDNKMKELKVEMEAEKEEQEVVQKLIDSIRDRQRRADEDMREKMAALDDLKEQEDDHAKRLNQERRKAEKRTGKRLRLQDKIDECGRQLKEIGSLPADAFTKYQDVDLATLQEDFQACNADLKKCNVNLRALDQHNKVVEELEKRRVDLTEAEKELEGIETLMDSLSNEKDQKIEFTFKQVASHFEDIFQKLTSGGKGRLILHSKDPATETTPSSSSTPSTQRTQRYADFLEGIGIQVSFSGSAGEMRDMQQLSGGQKTLVALGFIFAIQKCDPGPFYLFDEIDAFLDPTYRGAVAEMIRTISEGAQFITSTFHPELIEVADKVFGVHFRSKISSITEWDKEGALAFVTEAQ
eukprot:m.62405 g.62405  ORF g.62405 m.62405 type:complete len:1210 (+) comp35065_c0_seq13:385-4014(+)